MHQKALFQPRDSDFRITRVFDAPRATVWKAFSEAERLAQWWGPQGCKIHVSRLEFRPGGIFHYSMTMPNGFVMWGRFIYQEIAAPERIVFINSFSDAQGGLARAPWDATWPTEVLIDVALEEHEGKTTLNLRSGPLNPTEAEIQLFLATHGSMRQGFGGTWDQLAAYLATLQEPSDQNRKRP